MALTPGTRLGVYEITAQIGEGGMGQVYRATDTTLDRQVAIKILPDAFASDSERLARFEREAKTLASLNHPHIAAIYGFEKSAGMHVLVMELVEGEDLSQRIARSAIPIDEALPIAKQIAEALEAAHEQGIIHRDLKPANIKVRADGTVKVLDFGLAKAMEPVGHAPNVSQSPTITSPMTKAGTILGTAAYMSPEQAKGRPADKRSDVWAFGCVLYEMLTSTRAFDGEDTSETLASVLKSDPDWTLLPIDVPPAVRTLVQRCLVRDPRQRVPAISTARFVLSELGWTGVSGESMTTALGADARRSRREWALAAALVVALIAIAIGTAVWAGRPTPAPPAVAKFAFASADQSRLDAIMQMVAISPDGTQVAYPANGRIYVRSLDTLESRAVPGSENVGINPVFAPDGQSLLLTGFSERGVVLRRLPIGGGAASTVATLEGIPWVSGVTWNRDGILVGGGELEILQIPLNGEKPKRIVELSSGEWVHGPQLLPDGDTVLFTMLKASADSRWDQDIRWDEARIVAQSLNDGTRRVLVERASDGRYLPTGHLLYFVGGTMYAVPFDADTLTVTGAAVAVVAGVRRGTSGINGFADAAISETGTLVYVPGPASLSAARDLVLSDGRGDPVPLKLPAADYSHPRVSPDALRLAVARTDGDATDIHTYDLSGTAALRRLTFGGKNRFPVWSHDGRRVTFQSSREGDSALWWQSVEGGTAERLTKPAQGEEHVPEAWSPDGRYLLFSIVKASRFSLWVFRLDGKTSERFGAVESGESLSATFSQDGRWVAYAATDKAGGSQSPNRGVFVEPFPATGDRHQAPKTSLDYHPRWAPDGRSIFYVPTVFSTIVSVPITTQPSVAFGTPIAVPHGPMPGLLSYNVRGYDALRGGTLVSVRSASGDGESGQAAEFRVVLNWREELKRLVPTN